MDNRTSWVTRHPWVLIVYLLGVTLAAFLLPQQIKPIGVALLFALQLVILAAYRKLDASLPGIFRRLRFLFLFLVGANALLPGNVDDPLWLVPAIGLQINLAGLTIGILMSAQIALVVLTTHVVRTIGDERSFIDGLRSLHVAPLLAYSLDTTLALLAGTLRGGNGGDGGGGDGGGGGGGGGGTGGGGGGGRSRGGQRPGLLGRWWAARRGGHERLPAAEVHDAESAPGKAEPAGVLGLFRALKNRDLSPLVEKINTGLTDAANHAQRLGLSEKRAHDVGVIGGIAAVMMAFKLVKILPGLPVMQGAKTIFFIPLYILAADRTHSRWGGTIAGGIMGFIAFLNGDSRYGIFEILKHLVPGLVIDLIWPLVRRFPLRIWILVLVGWIAAAARTSTQFAMILALGADSATLLIFPALKLVPNLIAGTLSALVSYPVLKHLGAKAIAAGQGQPSVTGPPGAEPAGAAQGEAGASRAAAGPSGPRPDETPVPLWQEGLDQVPATSPPPKEIP